MDIKLALVSEECSDNANQITSAKPITLPWTAPSWRIIKLPLYKLADFSKTRLLRKCKCALV